MLEGDRIFLKRDRKVFKLTNITVRNLLNAKNTKEFARPYMNLAVFEGRPDFEIDNPPKNGLIAL